MNSPSRVVAKIVEQSVLPALKLENSAPILSIVDALVEAGSQAIEITATTPGVFGAVSTIRTTYGAELVIGIGTVLDESTARSAISAGADLIVTPTLNPDVIRTALRYGAACFSGAFTPTEVSTAMQAGAHMVKVFPASLAGPAYMTHLRRVLPDVQLIPSGGITLENLAEYLAAGAAAVSGAREFVDPTGDPRAVHDRMARVLAAARNQT